MSRRHGWVPVEHDNRTSTAVAAAGLAIVLLTAAVTFVLPLVKPRRAAPLAGDRWGGGQGSSGVDPR